MGPASWSIGRGSIGRIPDARKELSPIFGDGLIDQAAAVAD
jgi:hypothetical protein